MPAAGRLTQAKRQRERDNQERKAEKRDERARRKEEKKLQKSERGPNDIDPDLAGIVPGPQPPILY
jgi:hypothetical protein